jgi:hypothetical protein
VEVAAVDSAEAALFGSLGEVLVVVADGWASWSRSAGVVLSRRRHRCDRSKGRAGAFGIGEYVMDEVFRRLCLQDARSN